MVPFCPARLLLVVLLRLLEVQVLPLREVAELGLQGGQDLLQPRLAGHQDLARRRSIRTGFI